MWSEMLISMIVVQCSDNNISSTNRVSGNDNKHIFIEYNGGKYPVTMISNGLKNELGISDTLRKWIYVPLKTDVKVTSIDPLSIKVIGQVHVEVSYLRKQSSDSILDFDTTLMTAQFLDSFSDTLMSRGQPIPFIYTVNKKQIIFQLVVTKLCSLDMTQMVVSQDKLEWGMCSKHTSVVFTTKEDSSIFLHGHDQVKTIFNPTFDFSKMGVGGLDEEFNTIFRRVFASRVLPLDVVEKMGIKHVKGILMHGPPGTGKTLMARQIGKMLNSREPKIVNGPEILNKYVGESENNIRKLFEDAEKEEKDKGKYSQLHIIIFDEIDSICKSRGSPSGGTGVGDSIVNQLLSKIDGINSLNNVLIIGMTNRLELLDEALTRPGRLELKIEIGLPSETGRRQIFDIHLAKLKENKMLSPNVSVDVLATVTKNYTGAEIEGLVRAASSYAYNRCINTETFTADKEKIKHVQVTHDDFKLALTEIQPSFGTSDEDISQYYMNSVVEWGKYRTFMEKVTQLIDRFRKDGKLLSLLLNGIPKDGKTTMAVNLARYTRFPFIKFMTPENMIGMSEQRKIEYINSAFQNAYKSKYSVIVIDDIDIMIDYNEVGDRYSNAIVQVLRSLIKKIPNGDNKLLIIGTMSGICKHVLKSMICDVFTDVIRVPHLYNGDDVRDIGFNDIGDLDFSERDYGIKEVLHAVNV